MSTDPTHPEHTLILTSLTGQVYISYPHSYLEPPTKKPTQKTNSGSPSKSEASTGSDSASPAAEEASREVDPGEPSF